MGVPYAIWVFVTAQLSGDMVKQLQRGLKPNSGLQSKSTVKTCTLILFQFNKEKTKHGKLPLQSVSSAKFHLLNVKMLLFYTSYRIPKGTFYSAFMY